MPDLRPLPPTFAATRAALHLVAIRILAPARYAATGHLGLVPLAGGFGIPEADDLGLAVIDSELRVGASQHRLTTLRAAAEVAGVDLDGATHPVLQRDTDVDATLSVDAASAAVLADWYGFCQEFLQAVAATAEPVDAPTAIQLWPEHFDLALELGAPGSRANFGGSPGDEAYAEPYLYVGPHEQRDGSFWNASFGAVLTYGELLDGNDPQAFLQHGRDMLRPD